MVTYLKDFYLTSHTYKITSVGKDAEKLELMHVVGMDIKWWSCCGKHKVVPQKN